MKQLTDKNFIDWESEVFGYGYGTGEEFTLKALKDFFAYLKKDSGGELRMYDYTILEKKLGKTVAWLMINILCRERILEYGTSPRFGWISEKGELLRDYLKEKSVNELYKLVMVDEDYIHCSSQYCNCGGKMEECCKKNPLF